MAETPPDRTDTLDLPNASMAESIDDSGSDISMSDATTEDDDSEPAPLIISSSSMGSKKRRHTPEKESNGHNGEIPLKRLKADPALVSQYTSKGNLHKDKSLLPAEIWHNIFVFTPPRMLGSLLQVNKLFNSYLDPSSSVNKPTIEPLSTSVAKFLDPDSIWQASRVLFRPGMPTPLAGFSELDMWKLACQKSCQFCHTKASQETTLTDQWHSGPGDQGVRIIWSFAIRSCASCLLKNSVKEIDLLLSSSDPSLIVPALPFVFLTDENHIVSHTSLQNGLPNNVHIAKYFFKPHIEDMKLEFSKAREMGTAAAEEWIKGLDDLGKDRRNDAVRWERWEALGGVHRMHASEPNEKAPLVLPSKVQTSISAAQPVLDSITIGLSHQNGRPSSAGKDIPQAVQAPQPVMVPFSTSNLPPRFDSPVTNGFSYPPRPATHQRTKEEAAEMKAARRAEIERRATLLDPPLSAPVLAHMSSFQAALQIIKPLDDSAWELLKPRLLSQRSEAEQREKDRVLQTRVLQEVVDERRHLSYEQQTKEAEKEWDDVQAPLRARIAGFADEIIRDGWSSGTKVTHDNSPQFAAEVLIYVRKRFYAEIAKDDAATRAAGQEPKTDPPNGPFTRKLILENMKWVFDSKIKPHTEQYRKELFLCNGCENNSKFYGFEGVVQHYAAKHTSSLSVGSIVVHWKAEWPEFPPFHPDPTQAKATPYTLTTPATYGNVGPPAHSGYGGWYPPASASVPVQSTNSHMYQPNSSSSYSQQNYGEQYVGAQNGFQNRNQGLQGTQYPGNGQAYQQPYPSLPDHMSQKNGYSHTQGSFAPSQAPVDPRAPPYHNGNNFTPTVSNLGAQQNQSYRTELEFVANTAREIWNSTTGIKEMLGSVRVYVIIHHVVNRSRGQFPSEPSLAMFIDGLSNNKEMRPVRNVNGLACKTCSSDPLRAIPGERKSFSLPQLCNHFQTHHIANQSDGMASDLYWINDMVQLPEMSKISALLYTPGMDDYKLKLIADIFPMAFPSPLPRVEAARAAVAQSETFHRNTKFGARGKNGKEYRHGNHASANQNGYESPASVLTDNYGTFSQPPCSDRNESLSSVPITNEDEYNPSDTRGTYGEKVPVYGPTNDLDFRGNESASAYDPRPVDHYSHVPRADEVLQHVPFTTPPSYRQPAGSHAEAIVSDDRISRLHSLQSRNKQSPLASTSTTAHIMTDSRPLENPDKLAREAEEQERLQEEALRATWEAERLDSVRRMHQPVSGRPLEDQFIDVRENFDEKPREAESPNRLPKTRSSQVIQERLPNLIRHEVAYNYDDGHGHATKAPQYTRERSPELVDHRYKLNNVIYREERQPSHGSGRGVPPSRYSRYESVRLENDRARSRSPVYVKVGSQPGQYRERSPVALQASQPEPVYRGQTPLGSNPQPAYERAPRAEYYYADEPRARQPAPQYLEPSEYIRVADPAGDYMIRRPLPVRRDPVYAQYEEDPYARQPAYDGRESLYEAREPIYETREPAYEIRDPVYEVRPPVSRSDPAYYEEYDPRNPAPPPATALRPTRYQ